MGMEGWLMDFAAGGGLWRAGVVVVLAMGALAVAAATTSSDPAAAPSVLDVWDKVKAPPAPQARAVDVPARTTALLILDIEERTTNRQRRPRAVASVPRIAALLARARAAGMPVAYSLTRGGSRETILEAVAPREGEPVVKASVDKFHGTKLESLLKKRGVKTVVIVGTSAEGAVLHTATAAAVRGFDVAVCVDGMSSSELYAEQYTAWHLVNAPGSRRRTTLTRTNLVRIKE